MIDLNIHKDGNTQKGDPANVKRTKKFGSDFLSSLLELDVMNAGEAATAMHQTLGRVVEKIAMAAALQSLTKEGITDKSLNAILDEMSAKKTTAEPDGLVAPGIN